MTKRIPFCCFLLIASLATPVRIAASADFESSIERIETSGGTKTLVGFAFRRSTTAPVRIAIYLDRPRGSKGSRIATIVADQRRIQAVDTLKRMGYRVDLALGADEGLELLRITHYDLVLCEADRAFADIHRTIRQFPPGRRRLTFYAIVGPRLHTLYDLEALAFSANLVINDREMPHLEPVLRKGLQDYEKLFRPLLDALAAESTALP